MGAVTVSDHLMFTALVLTWGNFVINYYQDDSSKRFNPKAIKNPKKRPQIENALHGVLVTWYLYRTTYVIALCFVKLSILWFYRAIATHRTFRRVVNATIAFVSMYSFASAVASIFQCLNPADSWSTTNYIAQFDPNRKAHEVKCFDPSKLWIFCGAANLLSDVVILLLPIPTLLSLRVPMSKRLALVGIFSIGLMAIVASSVRMWVIVLWSESAENSARFGTDLLLWGQVETNSGIISASIPFLRLLFQRSREERGVTQRRVEVSPPKPMGRPHDALTKDIDMETWALNERDDPEKSPRWGPFITVPAGLSSGSGNSLRVEPPRSYTML